VPALVLVGALRGAGDVVALGAADTVVPAVLWTWFTTVSVVVTAGWTVVCTVVWTVVTADPALCPVVVTTPVAGAASWLVVPAEPPTPAASNPQDVTGMASRAAAASPVVTTATCLRVCVLCAISDLLSMGAPVHATGHPPGTCAARGPGSRDFQSSFQTLA
jgi:hypothetical protein